MLGANRLHCHKKEHAGVVDSSHGIGRKGLISSSTNRYRAGIYWICTEIGRLESYGFRGTVTAGDRSTQKGGKTREGYVNLR